MVRALQECSITLIGEPGVEYLYCSVPVPETVPDIQRVETGAKQVVDVCGNVLFDLRR